MSPTDPIKFALLRAFEQLFHGKVYKHRQSTLGNFVASHLYEDLFVHGGSSAFNDRVTRAACVVNVEGKTRGVTARRGDGTFGSAVPGCNPVSVGGFTVAQGLVALTHIGAEFKIIATAHLKQIDRVLNDLTSSAETLKNKSPDAITVGFAAVNYSERWTGMEGTRSFPVERKPERAMQESEETSRRLLQLAAPGFDEFLLFKFRATNQEPFPFSWLNGPGTASDYAAAVVRLAALYERRFPGTRVLRVAEPPPPPYGED